MKACENRCKLNGTVWFRVSADREGRCVALPNFTTDALSACKAKGFGWTYLKEECVELVTQKKAFSAWREGEDKVNEDYTYGGKPWTYEALRCLSGLNMDRLIQTCRYEKCIFKGQ